MSSSTDGYPSGLIIHGRLADTCHASDCLFTPDCPAEKKDKEKGTKALKVPCRLCFGTLSKENSNPPYLCNDCQGGWKTTIRDIHQSIPGWPQKPWEGFFLVAINHNDIVGIYYPLYEKVPVYLGFICGKDIKSSKILFFPPNEVKRILRIFRGAR